MDNKVKISALSCIVKGKEIKVVAVNYEKDTTWADYFYADIDGIFDSNYKSGDRWFGDSLSSYIDDGTKIEVIIEYTDNAIDLIGSREVFFSLERKISQIKKDYNFI